MVAVASARIALITHIRSKLPAMSLAHMEGKTSKAKESRIPMEVIERLRLREHRAQ